MLIESALKKKLYLNLKCLTIEALKNCLVEVWYQLNGGTEILDSKIVDLGPHPASKIK